MTAGRGQRQPILQLLLAGNEVPCVALSRIILQYGARIKELRELGFRNAANYQALASLRLQRAAPATQYSFPASKL
jgi:hypothetical protein